MQKTILAVALASAFSMGTACSADTNVKILQGQGIDPPLEGKYQLGGDYTLDGMTESIAYKANIDLNGHNLTITTDGSVENDKGTQSGDYAFQNLTIHGKGNLALTVTGKDQMAFGVDSGSSLKADNIALTSKNGFCIWSEDNGTKLDIATNDPTKGIIDIKSTNEAAIYVYGTETKINITDFAVLNVSTTSVNNHGNAINQNGGELNISGGKVYLSSDKRTAFVSQAANAEHPSKTTFNVSELHVDANINLPEDEGGIERKTGAFTVSAGDVTVNADVFTVKVTESETNKKKDISALNIYDGQSASSDSDPVLTVNTKKTAITGDVVAKAGTSTIKSETLQVTGDVTVKQEASMPLTFSGKDSFLTGQANIEKSTARDGDNTLAFKENAVWTVKGESSVDALVVENATVDISATDKNVTATSLTGKNGTIVMDAAGENRLTATTNTVKELKAVASKTADYVTTEEAAKMLDRINAKGATITGEVKEGDYNGSIIVDQQGNTVTKTNSLMQDVLTLNGATTLSLNRILSNDIRKRMGDVRSAEGTTGAWARWDGGRLSGGAVENDFNTIQVGVDTLVPNQNFRVGFAGSYTNGDADFTRGSTEMDAWSLSAYGLWYGDNGMFADVIARVAKAETDVTADGAAKKGTLENYAYSLSGEFGWRYNLSEQFYVEPQGELTWTYIDEDDLHLGTASYTFDSMNSFMGRVGFATGMKCPNNKGDVYLRVSAVHEFAGDRKITGANGTTIEADGKDSWVEYSIGANLNLTPTTYFWADVERTEGATLDEDWRATVGVRHAF